VKLIITEEDHQFIDSIVERFDYDSVIERPEGVTDQEWVAYTDTHRPDLRNEITAAMVARTLKEAEVIPAVDRSIVGDIAQMLERPSEDPENREALNRAISKLVEARSGNTPEKDHELDAFMDESQRIVEAVAIGAGV
jgi:hypothetical protein